jgi:hypothetical protein
VSHPERLSELAAEAAADAPDALPEVAGPTTIWSVGGKPFAVLSGDTMEFRLDPVVGAAARHTPDTSLSARGEDWVAFRPTELDRYAEDRARSWFAAAYRRAVA